MSSPDQAPGGRSWDAYSELRFAIAELHNLASALGARIGADDEALASVSWDEQEWRCIDLLERCYRDIGDLSAAYLRCFILDRRGIDPLD